jgi:hypothetical protein
MDTERPSEEALEEEREGVEKQRRAAETGDHHLEGEGEKEEFRGEAKRAWTEEAREQDVRDEDG